jgi:hypothetical protein
MGVITEAITLLPNRHSKNVNDFLKEYKPVFCTGERYTNALNTEELIEGLVPDLLNLKLSILDSRGNLVAEDIAGFGVYDVDVNDARLTWDILEFPELPEGRYRIVIYEEVNNKLYFASNLHEVINTRRKLEDETAYLVYRHSAKIYRMPYEDLPDFFVRTRVHINAIDAEQTFNSQEYEEVSTGESYNPRFDIDQQFEIETENYDLEAHKAFATFLAHNNMTINNKVYAVSNGAKYGAERDKNSKLWNGSIKLKQVDFSTINKQ